LAGVEALAPEGEVKLGFRAHYPQLETKLAVRGQDMDQVRRKLAPVEAEVRRRLGNVIVAEDDQTLERNVLDALGAQQASLAIVETFTGGQIAARLAPLIGAERVFRRGLVALDRAQLVQALGVRELTAEAAAQGARQTSGASHGLAVLVEVDEGEGVEFGGVIDLAVASGDGCATRRSRLAGGREWLRLGAIELGLDCLRRYLMRLPVDERIDFERTSK